MSYFPAPSLVRRPRASPSTKSDPTMFNLRDFLYIACTCCGCIGICGRSLLQHPKKHKKRRKNLGDTWTPRQCGSYKQIGDCPNRPLALLEQPKFTGSWQPLQGAVEQTSTQLVREWSLGPPQKGSAPLPGWCDEERPRLPTQPQRV